MIVDRASRNRSKMVKEYLQRNMDTIEYFPIGSPEFNAVKERWRQERKISYQIVIPISLKSNGQ